MTNYRKFGQGGRRLSEADIERIFWSKVDIRGSNDCWNFKGGKNDYGYGMYREERAHRFAWRIFNRTKIPSGKFVLHDCDNPPCCNPRHLYIGTHLDNMQDKMKRGRHVTNPIRAALSNAELSVKTILAVRKLKGRIITKTKVAKRFGISRMTILRIWRADKYPCKEGFYI